MSGGRAGPTLNWKGILPFSLFSIALYASMMLLTGRSLLFALLSGLVWTLVFVPLLLWSSRSMCQRIFAKRGYGDPAAGPITERDLTVSLDPPAVVNVVRSAVAELSRARIISATGSGVLIRIGMSFRSWGEKVRVDVEPASEGARVRVVSRPALRTTVYDWGKGQENVEHIVDALESAQA